MIDSIDKLREARRSGVYFSRPKTARRRTVSPYKTCTICGSSLREGVVYRAAITHDARGASLVCSKCLDAV